MIKANFLKKALAVAASTATLLTCTTVNTSNTVKDNVYAADGENYAEALAMSLYFFDSNECGCEVDSNPLNWRGNCHTYDAKAAISNATNFPSQYRSIVDPDGDGYVDVSGGYHDAGDHVKFNLTNAFAGSSLAMSYYLNDGAYEKAGCKDHLFEIMKKISDYLMKTTFLNSDGSVATICYNVSDSSDHNYWQSPEVQTYDRKTYWMSSSNNNSAICGQMASALGGAAYILKDADPEYANECLKYAKAIYQFGTSNSGNETAGMGDMYGTDSETRDDLGLAAIWLYLNNAGSLPTYKPTNNGCYDNSMYDYHYYCWNKVWSGYAAMMYKITGDSSYASEMQFELNNKGGVPTNSYNATDQGSWGGSRYNCALQMLAIQLAKGDANSQYALGAKYQMDYLLGNNSLGYSFLIGYGNKWPVHIHHRAANPGEGDPAKNPTATYTNYGMLIGGPSDSNGTYQDHANMYQYTEPALDYNSCFALACAGLVNLYGGDASALDPIIAAAPEIDETHTFGNGEIVIPTEPSTEQTTESTTEENPPVLLGDVNNDNVVNISDLIVLQRYLVKDFYHIDELDDRELGGYVIGGQRYTKLSLDVNTDEKINVFDSVSLRRILIELLHN